MSAVDLDSIIIAIGGPDRARVETVQMRGGAWLALRVRLDDSTRERILSTAGPTPTSALTRLLAAYQGEEREEAADASIAEALAASIDEARERRVAAAIVAARKTGSGQ